MNLPVDKYITPCKTSTVDKVVHLRLIFISEDFNFIRLLIIFQKFLLIFRIILVLHKDWSALDMTLYKRNTQTFCVFSPRT